MDKKIGFIGCGNMAGAMIGGLVNSKLVTGDQILASDAYEKGLNANKEKYGINICLNDNKKVASCSDIIILSVKPDKYKVVIEEISTYIKENAIIVTIAAGITTNFIEDAFKKNVKVVRTMPNTAALVGESMTALCHNDKVTTKELNEVVSVFQSFGKTEILDEKLMEAVIAVNSSSLAYVDMMIEAMGDGGVLAGIPRDKAYKLASQAVLGAAKMVLETGKHPGELKDMVCSPAGTTIEAVYSLEKSNFRGAIIEAMEKCREKALKMSGK